MATRSLMTYRIAFGLSAMAALTAVHCPRARAGEGQATTAPSSSLDLGSWEDGLKMEWRSEWLSLRVGGKAMGDVGRADGKIDRNTDVSPEDGSELRMWRPYISGTIAEKLDFKLEQEFTRARV